MQESPVFVKTYDMLLWIFQVTAKFPKEYRFSLGQRLQETGLDFQGKLTEAGLGQGNTESRALAQADVILTKLRQLFRLSKDLGCLSPKQYQHSARFTTEVGNLVGGWRQSIKNNQPERERQPRRPRRSPQR